MARVIDDQGALGRATKPLGLRVYEPGNLPDPVDCPQSLIIVNDRSDGLPRARLALSNGASWDYLSFTIENRGGHGMPATVDLTPMVQQLVTEQLPAIVRAAMPAQPTMRVISPDPGRQQLVDMLLEMTSRLEEVEDQLRFVIANGASTQIEAVPR
jgi:hypothetical protein